MVTEVELAAMAGRLKEARLAARSGAALAEFKAMLKVKALQEQLEAAGRREAELSRQVATLRAGADRSAHAEQRLYGCKLSAAYACFQNILPLASP